MLGNGLHWLLGNRLHWLLGSRLHWLLGSRLHGLRRDRFLLLQGRRLGRLHGPIWRKPRKLILNRPVWLWSSRPGHRLSWLRRRRRRRRCRLHRHLNVRFDGGLTLQWRRVVEVVIKIIAVRNALFTGFLDGICDEALKLLEIIDRDGRQCASGISCLQRKEWSAGMYRY
jgi:hypothetical protein